MRSSTGSWSPVRVAPNQVFSAKANKPPVKEKTPARYLDQIRSQIEEIDHILERDSDQGDIRYDQEGFCCWNGNVTPDTAQNCGAQGGFFTPNEGEAMARCPPRPVPGFCCWNGNVMPDTAQNCLGRGGFFTPNRGSDGSLPIATGSGVLLLERQCNA